MISVNPKNISGSRMQHYLLEGVAPRPIALASTVDEAGNPNLSPFSFYNAFGSNPPLLIFSPARRGRDNTTKDTLENLKKVPELVINAVTRSITEQVSLASSEFPNGVNEFVKSGLTALPSQLVKPYRVKESPLHFECMVKQIIETGNEGGAGNLVICEILMIHVNEDVLDETGHIDPHRIDLVGRMGGDYYVKASGDALFKVAKPGNTIGIGVDSLPFSVRNSSVLTGRHLGILGNIDRLPQPEESLTAIKMINDSLGDSPEIDDIHKVAVSLIEKHELMLALAVLLKT